MCTGNVGYRPPITLRNRGVEPLEIRAIIELITVPWKATLFNHQSCKYFIMQIF